jgi:isopentenyl diphosphate isomerase/L-lactate dehydrogenase-like FMN-dependent dehydrogenase
MFFIIRLLLYISLTKATMKKVFGLIALVSLMALVSCGKQAIDTVEKAADAADVSTTTEQVVDVTADTVKNAAEATVNAIEVPADLPTPVEVVDDKAMMEKVAQ